VPILSGSQTSLKVYDRVFKTNRSIYARCGFSVLGEIFSPLGLNLAESSYNYDEYALGRLFKTSFRSVDMRSPGIVQRSPVTVPFMTGVASVDSFIPVGCGQRELIIGDQNTGKTSLAITAIINQSYRNNTVCGI
jgi:F-type H+/Na+-transporting ATPase subunit alpha